MSDNVAKKSINFKELIPVILKYIVLVIAILFILVPIVIIIFGGLKTRGEFYTIPYIPPIPPRWDNIIKILNMPIFWYMMRNSVVVTLTSTAGVVIVSSMSAFVFARMDFKGKNALFQFFTLGLMFPATVAILPIFLIVRQLGLQNNLISVILVLTTFQISMSTVILRNFFMEIPSELQDAALIDGCNRIGFFLRILLPLAKPSLAAVASLAVVNTWNDLLVALVLIDKEKLWTLQLGVMQFQGQYGQDLSLVSAFLILASIPAVIFYMFAQRHIVSGLTAGSIKG
jgi:raffinose/stachyose/melibiose transport system permease protein